MERAYVVVGAYGGIGSALSRRPAKEGAKLLSHGATKCGWPLRQPSLRPRAFPWMQPACARSKCT